LTVERDSEGLSKHAALLEAFGEFTAEKAELPRSLLLGALQRDAGVAFERLGA
jgi:hypothetical protein